MVAYSFKRRFVVPIQMGLGITLKSFADLPPPGKPYPKRQTIRAHGKRHHAAPGGALQLYCGMRTSSCFKIGDATCLETMNVIIWIDPKTIAIERAKVLLNRDQMEQFAREDGFTDAADMAAFWRTNHAGIDKFEGLLIKWEPINAQ